MKTRLQFKRSMEKWNFKKVKKMGRREGRDPHLVGMRGRCSEDNGSWKAGRSRWGDTGWSNRDMDLTAAGH